MKPASALLLASLAGNVALFGLFVFRRPVSPPAPPAANAQAPELSRAADASGSAATVGHEFLTLAPAELRERLRALDLPPDIVNHLVRARIFARVRARENELLAEALKSAPPWKLAGLRNDRLSILTPDQRKELRDLDTEARAETLRVLGPHFVDRDGQSAFKYAFVSPEKAVALAALDRDYEQLEAQLREESRYLKTPGDRDREKFLRTERQRDLATLLSPAELEDYELRASATARNGNFQARMAAFQGTEAEYRALFALQKAVDDRIAAGLPPPPAPPPMTSTASMIKVTGSANDIPDQAVREALGDARFADWQLAKQRHYQELVRVAAANSLPSQAVREVSSALSQAMNTSWTISEDATKTPAEKRAALAALAAQARGQVTAHLGPTLAESYLRSTGWFDSLAAGSAVRVDGTTTLFRSVDPSPPPAGASPSPTVRPN